MRKIGDPPSQDGIPDSGFSLFICRLSAALKMGKALIIVTEQFK